MLHKPMQVKRLPIMASNMPNDTTLLDFRINTNKLEGMVKDYRWRRSVKKETYDIVNNLIPQEVNDAARPIEEDKKGKSVVDDIIDGMDGTSTDCT